MNSKALCAVIAPLAALCGYALWPRTAVPGSASIPAAKATVPAVAFKTGPSATHFQADPLREIRQCELNAAVQEGVVKAHFTANGRDKMRATLTNTSASALRVEIPAGQEFSSGKTQLIAVRPRVVEIEPATTTEAPVQTITTSSTAALGEGTYTLSALKNPRFAPLLAYAGKHVELSLPALQTMALVIAENLPLSAVMKFTPSTEELKSRFNTDAFRVETFEIISALTALREMGIADASIAMTIDPQLKIEAMIEPLSKAAAMRYYAITPEKEWDYWKAELLNGAPATRHYALYGIARFYPEVALDMLPKWVREARTNPVYRLSALQALADTRRPEALPLLRGLAEELGPETELGRAAVGAAGFLEQHLRSRSGRSAAVAFRAAETHPESASAPEL